MTVTLARQLACCWRLIHVHQPTYCCKTGTTKDTLNRQHTF